MTFPGSGREVSSIDLIELARLSETLSPLLVRQAVFLLIFALGLSLTLWIVLGRRVSLARLHSAVRAVHGDSRGAVISADFILAAVPILVFVTLMVQMTWLMRETIIVHYAAFAAARSAKVQECPLIPAGINAAVLASRDILCTGDDRKREDAARYALISASPPWNVPCLASCKVPDAALRAIARNSGIDERTNAIIKQARYAYDQPNVQLHVSVDDAMLALAGKTRFSPGVRPAMKAELTYRHYIIKWVGKLLGERRSDGLYYRETRAIVRLM
jgi:hypothetical protein